MAEDFEIELLDEPDEQQSNLQLPMNYTTVGEVENDDLKVYIRQDVYKRLEKFASSDLEHELGSILLGQYSQTMGKTHVVISDYIEAKYTDASSSTLTFTHESWDYIHEQHEKKFPDLRILGWQHTHPGYGIFLSNYDMFIQENFFNLPFQVAYVIDPKQKTRGFFQWKGNRVEKLKGFFVYDDVGKPVKVDVIQPKETTRDGQRAGKLTTGIALAVVAVVALLCGVAFQQSKRIRIQTEQQAELSSVVAQQSEQILALQDEMTRTTTAPATEEPTTKPQQEITQTTVPATQPTTEKVQDASSVTFVYYTVKPGDTLYGICKANGLDYATVKGTIQSLNGLDNVDQIHAGQILILPSFGQ